MRLFSLPVLLQLPLWFVAASLVVAGYGFWVGDEANARALLYWAVLMFCLIAACGFAIGQRVNEDDRRTQLLILFGFYLGLPLVLAIPLREGLQTTTYLHAYLDIISAITTTGLPVFEPERVPDTLRLWHACVAWLGGFFLWVCALSLLSPLLNAPYTRGMPLRRQRDRRFSDRFQRDVLQFAPIYIIASVGLALALTSQGNTPIESTILAMGTLATAGIGELPVGGTPAVIMSEAFVGVFLILALSRNFITAFTAQTRSPQWWGSPEIALAASILCVATAMLFARHFLGAATLDGNLDERPIWVALWGIFFTCLSFLTTAGYVSEGWTVAQNWSGLSSAQMILVALALVGGGAATTAGGAKLIRMALLLIHSWNEVEAVVLPSAVRKQNPTTGTSQERPTRLAWVFFMVFALSFAFLLLGIMLWDVPLEEGLALTTAALSNTGPLIEHALPNGLAVLELDTPVKLLLIVGMVLGRLEVLILIALLNVSLWRR